MRAWVIAIVGIVVLGVLLEIILPDGEVTKYIRGIFAIIVVVVIVTPITQILSGQKKLEFDLDGYNFDYDNNYISYFYTQRAEYDCNSLSQYLNETEEIQPMKIKLDLVDNQSYIIKAVKLYYTYSQLQRVNKQSTTQRVKKIFGNVEVNYYEYST